MSINIAALDTRHCKKALKFRQTLIIYTLTARWVLSFQPTFMTQGHFSALAGYPSWYCYVQQFVNKNKNTDATQYCCDIYENNGTPGVKYTGSFQSYVRTGFFLQSALFVNR
jgi:hypothetical protein